MRSGDHSPVSLQNENFAALLQGFFLFDYSNFLGLNFVYEELDVVAL